MSEIWDVVVVGAGNAALCAALAAHDAGAQRIVMVEQAAEEDSGGNSRLAGGGFRFCHSGIDDIGRIATGLTDEEIANTDFGTYTPSQYFDDIFAVTRYRADPDLAEQLVTRSLETTLWLRSKGVTFLPRWGREAEVKDGRRRFSGEVVLDAWGGGAGLVEAQRARALKEGVEIRYRCGARELIFDGRRIEGIVIFGPRGREEIRARAVVLACGGFEANLEWRARYLGAGWVFAKVRGTRYNVGEGIRMALAIGARSEGHWSSCHSVAWDNQAPASGDLARGEEFQRFSYPYGITVNANGRRFFDEGEDLRIRNYYKSGREILTQPEHFAWQVFDAKSAPLLENGYRARRATKVTADTLEELAAQMEGVDAEGFLDEVRCFNAAVPGDELPFNHRVKDGRGTRGLNVPKSNWACAVSTPPFVAYQVGCGITFTYGGLATSTSAQVLDTGGEGIPGLYAAGEILGGLFYFGYPAGGGLMAGAVFGRIAGDGAARAALAAWEG